MGNPQLFQEVMVKSIGLFLIVLLSAQTGFAIDVDFLGYLRGGTGVNLEGGKQECFYNVGIPGNFLRLGNECSFYTEIGMIFQHKKAEPGDEVFFRTQVRLMNGASGGKVWEAAAYKDMNQVEAFVTAGGFSEIPGSVWIGKRFYRDVDLHIFDWYYYADMSGVGAGWEDIPVGKGYFAIAHLIQANDDFTSVGRPVLQALDMRIKSLPIGAEQNLNLWGVFAWAPASSTATETYVQSNGYSLSARIQGQVWGGNNNSALLYGKGAMKDLNIYASSVVPATDDKQNKAWTLRFVEDWSYDVTDRWGLMLGAAAQYGENGDSVDNKITWQEIGIRPIYYFSDRFQMVFEAGYSHILDESEKDGNGNAVGDRELGRITIAPQLSIKKSIWGRPVMRAFLSHSVWNTANRDYIKTAAPTFEKRDEGTSFGYQFEVWF
jgi:maltoporin